MAEFLPTTGRWTVALTLAASLLFSNMPLALAGPGDTNSTNVGGNVVGGNYYNTAGNQTTFTNTGNITVGAGTTVRGLEVNGAGTLTGNGGHLHFETPGTLRIDGTVNASALMQGGSFQGNGGTISANAGALVQNGNVLVNGLNGGNIVFNVGNLTVGPNARFEAIGTGANGMAGQINLNSTGQVSIPNGAVIDASGNYIGGYNANVIQISGSIVNLDGVVTANGLVQGANGGAIGVYGSEIKIASTGKIQANGAEGGQGGSINIAATNSIKTDAGSEITANGGKGGNGGAILMGTALDASGNPLVITKNVQTDGSITANGGMATDTLNAGMGGTIGVIADNALTNNGQILANGGDADAGNLAGQGGVIAVGGRLSLLNNGQISANGGNGGSGVDAANAGRVLAVSEVSNVNNGLISANGGHGFNGYMPSNGGEGGLVEFAGDTVENNGQLTANGGNGGTNPTVEEGPVVDGYQVSLGQNGGNGGNGGAVVVSYNTSISGKGTIEVKGGDGGAGQQAFAGAQGAHQDAIAGNGGNGGFGGLVKFYGEPGPDVLNNVNVNGGTGGQGGAASILSDCGCATPGSKGACGAPGQIVTVPKPPVCTGGTCAPPPPNSPPPLFPLYPKEYTTLGDTLPPNSGNVLSYTRSIFLARSPLPIIKKKEPIPPPPPAKVMVVKPKPKPKPPQKKVPVRGYW